ncbi:MAG TPA: prepilin peptidase [Polyangiaceae bacterium]|nr:prepilin peptidase [Polyangiaceae bacterium]
MTLADIAAAPWGTSLARVFAFAWGCIWGSFVNVVVYRVPRELSVVRPGSHCPSCGAPVRAVDNVPVVSWLLLGGRARCCGGRISPRYPVIELLGGLLALAIFESVVRGLPAGASLASGGSVFLADFALAMALVAAAFIDAEHMLVPDAITIGGTIFGIATPALRGLSWLDVVVGASVGFVGIWLPFIVAYKALRGRHGMGLGDAKLVMLAGAWFGWRGAVFALFAGALQATLAALVLVLVRGKIDEPESVLRQREELERAAAGGDDEARRLLVEDPLGAPPAPGLMSARMPFGPFLCCAIIEWMLAGRWIEERWGLGP